MTNDTGFITKSISNLENYFTKNEVTSMINNVSSIRFEIVDELPETGNTSTIYLLAKTKAVNNTYDEYIFVNDNWELIGTTSVDLSNYYTISQTDSKFALKSVIPVVNNSTITITQNGTSRGSFTLNQAKNSTIEISDTNYTLPTASSETLGGIKVGSNLTITNGVLSAVQGKVTIDDSLSSTSTNAIQNKIVNTALANKQDSLTDEQLSAVNSGITSNKIITYDSYASQIENKADATYATDAEIEALFANN